MTHASPPDKPLTYKQAGVDITAGNDLVRAIAPLAKATARPGVTGGLGGFGGLFDLKQTGFEDPILVAANDGVGTKLKLAFQSGRHDTIGIDLVAMCVNDLVVQGAEPLFFLDYFATGKLSPGIAETVIGGITEGCRLAGAALIGGETAEMPGMYAQGEYDLAGFSVGAVERDKILPRPDIAAGDVILGLESSGLHSNGFSLVRRLVERDGTPLDAPCPFDDRTSFAAALLAPTRIYVKSLLETLASTSGIKALAHITGGGLTENIPRVLPEGTAARINLGAIRPPAVFGWAARTGHMEEPEVLRTFNCGIGMAVIAAPDKAAMIRTALQEHGEVVTEIGLVEGGNTAAKVHYDGRLDLP